MRRFILAGLVLALYLLHQDIWFWTTARPLVAGAIPIGLFYHVVYCLAAAGLMFLLVKTAWPEHLEAGDWRLEAGESQNQPQAPSPQRPS